MDGVLGSRLVRLLKRSSVHNRPSHIAAALALGVLAGLVPKTTGIGIGLCLVVLLSPIHNLFGLCVLAALSPFANAIDSLSHTLGLTLLNSPTLIPLWQKIESASLLPWLGMQNTVVVGSAVIGVLQLGPTYVIAFHVLRKLYSANEISSPSVIRRFDQAEASRAPAPHFRPRPPAAQDSQASTAPDSQPPQPIGSTHDGELTTQNGVPIGRWHIGSAPSQGQRTVHLIGAASPVSPKQLAISNEFSTAELSSAEIVSDGYRSIPNSAEWDEPRTSVEIVRAADEMIAWIDEALTECLALDCNTANEHEQVTDSIEQVAAPETIVASSTPSADEQWLMETTIEIIRWADSVELNHPRPTESPQSSVTETSSTMQTSIANSTADSQTIVIAIDTLPERAVKSVESRPSDRSDQQTIPFPQRGETLSYLIQYLRESRDGNTQ